MFITWASPLDLGFTFMDGARQTGSALAAIPLEIERPAPGTRVLIPAPFLRYQCSVRENFALLYDHRKDQWLSLPRPARTMLRFQVPTELLPLRIEGAILEVDIHAPGYRFDILAGRKASTEVLATRNSPVGKLHFEIDGHLLQPDAEGGIFLGLAVANPSGPRQLENDSAEWRINDVQLELTGQTPGD
jgi:hypothetical protein